MLEEEKIVRGYDPQIMRRLLSYLKPYKLLVAIALVGLLFSTVGDLLLPVIIQKSVDNELIVYHYRIPKTQQEHEALASLDFEDQGIPLGDYIYVHKNKLEELSGLRRQQLIDFGVLDEKRYYLFPLDEESRTVIESRPKLFLEVENTVVISMEDRERLSKEELRTIRNVDTEALKRNALLMFLVLAGILVFTFFQIYFITYAGQEVMKDLRLSLFSHTMGQSLAFLDKNPVGRLVSRLSNDVETINELFTNVLVSFLKDISLMIGVIVTLFLLNSRLAWITLLSLPPVFLITIYFRKKSREVFRRVRLWISRVNTYLSEHISGMDIVKTFVQETRCNREFAEKNKSLLKANLGEMYVFAVFRPLIDLFASISIGVIIYFGARFFLEGLVSLGILIAFINLIRRFYQPVRDISEKYNILQSAMAGGERVFELLDEQEEIPDNGNTYPSKPIRGNIEFESVYFSYKPNEPVIRDLSFTVNAGESVAIVGYTGAGKTTIANLLTRLWDIDSGSIKIDGIDIREYPLKTLRRMVQPVQQDVFLFSDTIYENIGLGENRSEQEIIQAAKMVQADRFIRQDEAAYKKVLNEGASNISTGQRQLLSFARVIAHDPCIIILDEATANIDTETEQLIQKAMWILMADRTSLVIAHRLSTIKNSNRIIVLSKGRIAEEGTHEELLTRKGIYYNLYRLQYQERTTASEKDLLS